MPDRKKIGEYLEVERLPSKGKTCMWDVFGQKDSWLGRIHWAPGWRKYVFRPQQTCIFDRQCLLDIAAFLEQNKDVRQ